MTAPYFVEQTKRYGETGLLKRRFNYDTLEAARDRYDRCIEEENTSRVALLRGSFVTSTPS